MTLFLVAILLLEVVMILLTVLLLLLRSQQPERTYTYSCNNKICTNIYNGTTIKQATVATDLLTSNEYVMPATEMDSYLENENVVGEDRDEDGEERFEKPVQETCRGDSEADGNSETEGGGDPVECIPIQETQGDKAKTA